MAKCAQRRRTSGCTSTAHSHSTFGDDARLLSTQTPMHTSNCRQPSGGRSHSSSRLTRSTRPSSSCKIDRSSSSSIRSKSSSSRTYSSVCSKSRASSKSMTMRTLKKNSMSTVIDALSTSTSSNTLKIMGRLTRSAMRASMEITRRMWCCRLPSSICLLSLDATALRLSGTTTTTRANSTCYLLCHMSSSRWCHDISSQTC